MKERSWRAMQEFVDRLATAQRYCSDGLDVYQELMWSPSSEHILSHFKEETHTIESMNADLRTYRGHI
jgi:IS1 family transposase